MRFALCLLLLAPVISKSAVIVLVVPSTITPFRIVGSDHLISVTSIYVDEVPLPLNPSLLEGGAKLSAVVPYTFMNVPVIEIGLPGRAGEEKWRFYGTNTVVKVLETVVYLAFVDGERSLMSRWSLDTSTSEYMIEFYFSTTLKTVSDSFDPYTSAAPCDLPGNRIKHT
ncbi:unnamed protein product [Brassica oleracea]|uniref:Uncharacterized protein n=1 Tax=Brassica oleracea TaxID=3712 RepID=A0A3P6E5J1_BRAOL|nr:unnamed protein product [Brassica oleracea]